jgi:archaellum component FlaC
MENNIMKKVLIKIAGILGLIGGILFFFLGFKKKEDKPVEIDENQKKVDAIKNLISREKGKRGVAKRELVELKKISDGRSKEVKGAKKSVEDVDNKIKDLEQQLRDAGIDI